MDRYLQSQLTIHPGSCAQDIVKLCFQATFGAEHLLSDPGQARIYFETEYGNVFSGDETILEEISEEYCRVNFYGWKSHGLSEEKLLDLFLETGTKQRIAAISFENRMEDYQKTLLSLGEDALVTELSDFLKKNFPNGPQPVHHSERYRELYHPHYRIIQKDLLMNEMDGMKIE